MSVEKVAFIFDRGAMDIGAFLSAEQWSEVQLAHKVTSSSLLSRYDIVLHFRTAADGAADYYKAGKTTDDHGVPVVRTSTPEAAIAKDKKCEAIWSLHGNVYILENLQQKTFKDKVAAAVLAIDRFIAA